MDTEAGFSYDPVLSHVPLDTCFPDSVLPTEKATYQGSFEDEPPPYQPPPYSQAIQQHFYPQLNYAHLRSPVTQPVPVVQTVADNSTSRSADRALILSIIILFCNPIVGITAVIFALLGRHLVKGGYQEQGKSMVHGSVIVSIMGVITTGIAVAMATLMICLI